MDSIRRNKLQDLICLGSQRVAFHPIIPNHRQTLHPIIKEHGEFVSYDKAIVTGIVLCKHCHQIFANARWSKKSILNHFHQVHKIQGTEEPIPKFNSETSTVPIATCPSIKKNKEAKATPPTEVIVIDDDDIALPIGESTPTNQPVKKKRGRKPKILSTGIQEQEKKKKPEKKVRKRKDVGKLKKHESKKIKLREEANGNFDCV